MFNRRQFAFTSTACLAHATGHLDRFAIADTAALSNQRLVRQGLNALARASDRSYFANGHRGASMISAHLMCVDNDFSDEMTGRIVELFDLNWASGPLCESFPQADPVLDAEKRVGETLASSGEVLREVGHDAIFAMHAIKAFRMMPELATKQRVDGICKLIGCFKPWRDNPPSPDVHPPPFAETQAASRFVLKEASQAIDRFQGFGQGFAGHMLTFGQSLIELAALGHVEWAESCRTAFRKYVTVTRQGPAENDRRIKAHANTDRRPDDSAYWTKRGERTLGLGHVFKYPYAYYDLLERAQDESLRKELDAKAWEIF